MFLYLQGGVLGPVLFFTLYTQPFVQEIVKFNLKYQFYADDTPSLWFLFSAKILNNYAIVWSAVLSVKKMG